MANWCFELLTPGDQQAISLIASWYLSEWSIPLETSIERLKMISQSQNQFQLLMKVDDLSVATAGLHEHVGLLNREPRFGIYKHWLALVYTPPEFRSKGYASAIYGEVEKRSLLLGVKELFLFTHTAERLYRRLGWQELERLHSNGRDTVVMKKRLLRVI